MPVQYTPQFIPTNAQALQGVLSEYQQAYDQNLARELEVQDQYSMIPTIDAADTQRKNELLGNFANTLGEVEKKYNYDRASSAYSKELARKIGELRKNDFWSYNERKKELAKAEAEDKRRIGAGYVSKYSPSQATYEDQTALDNYQPMNLEDLYKQVYNKGKEWATVNKTPIEQLVKLDGTPIAVERGWQQGYATPEEITGFLSRKEGQDFIDTTITSSGFADLKDDPKVRQMAIDAAYASLIGERQTDKYSIPAGFYKDQSTPFSTPVSFKKTEPAIVRNGKAYNENPTAIVKDNIWGERKPSEFKSPIEVVKETAGQIKSGDKLAMAFPMKTLVHNGVTSILKGLFPGRDTTTIDSPDNQFTQYMLKETLSKSVESYPELYTNGINIMGKALKEYGVEGVSPEELLEGVLSQSWIGGEKNAINKTLERITGKDLSKGATGRDLGREYNTWYEAQGSMYKDMLSNNINNLGISRNETPMDYTYKATEQNQPGDYFLGVLTKAKPKLVGANEKDKSTKKYMANDRMDFFDEGKIKEFYQEGNYRIIPSTSGDDLPYFTLINSKGESLSFEFPLDRFEGPLYEQLAYHTKNPQLVQDAITSSFDILPGQVVSEPDGKLQTAVIKFADFVGADRMTANNNMIDFLNKYDIRKKLNPSGDGSYEPVYEFKPKETNDWNWMDEPMLLNKAQLLEVIVSANK